MDPNLPAPNAESRPTAVRWARDFMCHREIDVLAGLPEGLGTLTFDRSMCGGGYQLRGVKPADHDRLVAYLQACRPGRWVRSYPEVHVVAWQQ